MTIFDKINTKSVFVLFIICVTLMILDSIIVTLYIYSREPDISINLYIFILFTVLFVVMNQIFLKISRINLQLLNPRLTNIFKFVNLTMVLNQVFLASLLLASVFNLLLHGVYDLNLISFAVNCSFFFTLGLMIFTSYYFFKWFKTNRSYVVVLYAIGFSLLALNLISSSIYLNYNFSHHDNTIRLKHIKTQIIEYSNYYSDYGIQINSVIELNRYLSVVSFLSIWIPTVILLKTYSVRFGTIKYWILVSIPLAYFVLPILIDKFNILEMLSFSYDRQSILMYNLIFTPSKQIGGFLFGMIFLIMAHNIKRKPIKFFINLTGIGIALLFGSTVVYGLTYIVSPPFGVITVLFMNLASYMVFIGFYVSVKELSRDQRIYRELNNLKHEFSLLRNLSRSEMEKTIYNKIGSILNKPEIKEMDIVDVDTTFSDYKEWVNEILHVVERKKH